MYGFSQTKIRTRRNFLKMGLGKIVGGAYYLFRKKEGYNPPIEPSGIRDFEETLSEREKRNIKSEVERKLYSEIKDGFTILK